MSIAAYSITDLLSSTEARSSSAVRTEPYDIHVLGLDWGGCQGQVGTSDSEGQVARLGFASAGGRLLAGAALRLVGLEEDARGGLERAAEGDQPACLGDVDLAVVRHQR